MNLKHLLMLGLATASLLPAQEANRQVVHQKTEIRLREIAARTRGALGFVALDLTSGERFALNETLTFPQASAIKIAILMEVYKQAEEGKFKLTDARRIARADKVGGSGILKHLGDDTVELSLADLCVLMIVLSDNTATNLLIDLVGLENINRTLDALGLPHTRVRRRMLDTAASWRGDENVSTPAEAARIMEILFKGEFQNRATCEAILALLRQTQGGSIQAALPAHIPVAFKPGGIAGVTTEWAIVELPGRPYVLVVMENYGLETDADTAIKELAVVVHEHFSRLAQAAPHGAYVEKPR
ncbi:MAG TPA: class A beta-lactamase-related serine hydrolase [Verrucomicrobiota bacterium]|jgi:beta-lactamase class A|nr:MAG: Beta-lactamase CARB-6 precursor [Verrucomicrobia bacterium ADurb.Bin118]HPY29253.1 class A beta-lactamase-related serine hydrolase [Verrucomicrobiota bacterium]HQB15174.1 class A beta-lactamase-related serine hydrolase [Verrucomicrobiota bacterium]